MSIFDEALKLVEIQWEELPFELPTPPHRGTWMRVVDTSLASPQDLAEPGEEVPVRQGVYRVGPRSVVVLRNGVG